jgi:hypothetical protein
MPMPSRGSFGNGRGDSAGFDSSKPKPLSKNPDRTTMKKDIPEEGFDELEFFLKQQEEEQKGIDEVNKMQPKKELKDGQ